MSLVIKHFISECHKNTNPVKHAVSCSKLFCFQRESMMLKSVFFQSGAELFINIELDDSFI